ncbi:hypothetical protein LX74_03977 [Elizabethkingia miricola]|uniref:Late control protein n=2 Tax=Elizabethkingia miricola TaxID=172045 RepID=A0ABY3NAM2_ELIMR|nr:hypothetical protein [Elizabethkingia miricola]TYO84553.1 hypothetical protein LX74_03977 [Elizabethkingia miricola]
MTRAMCAEIVFLPNERRSERIVIYKPSSVEIETSWKMICGKAEIILPRKVKDFNRLKVKEVFRKGDPVEISLGYDGILKQEFKGYIDQVSADYPISIKVEDEMWRLKQIKVNFSHKNIKLKEFIQGIVKDYPIDIDAEVSLGAVRFSKVTLGEVLNKIQQEFSLYSFIRNGKLTIAKPYSDVTEEIPVFDLERNCVSNNLNYLSKEDRLVKIVGQSMQAVAKAIKKREKDKKLKFEFGDPDAHETINWTFNVKTLKDLEREVKKMYEDRKKEGFDGSFKAFGFPSVQHGQKVKITSTLYNDRSGIYYIDRVKKTFNSSDGYKQEIELGQTFVKNELR